MAVDSGPLTEAADAEPQPRPAVRLRPPLTASAVGLRLVALGAAVALAWAWVYVGMSLTVVLDGLDDIHNLLGRMLPPRFVDTGDMVWLAVQTFFMAYIATCLATVLSVPLAFLAARNTTPHAVVRAVARAVISLSRAVPDLVFAIIFVRAVGLGPLAGIMAMGFHSVGMVGKLYADAIEQIDEQPRDAVVSAGASPRQALATAVVPQVLPSFIATSLYRLDINMRTSVILGFVGAGGIGFELQWALGQLVYDRAMGIVVVIGAMVVAIELISAAIRRSILGDAAFAPGRRQERRWRLGFGRISRAPVSPAPPRLGPPWTGTRVANAGSVVAAVVLGLVAFRSVDVSPVEFVIGLDDIWSTMARLFPPDFGTAGDEIRDGVVETLAIALVGTFLGLLLTLPLGFLSARNISPNRVVYLLARGFILVTRCIPELVLALIFVAAIGLGPIPGVFALAIATVGFMAKLMADGLEEVDTGPREAVVATGAGRVQEAAVSVVPQALPTLVGHSLYMLDVNVRLSTILGVVGAGGIGFLLDQSVRTLHLETTGAILLVVFLVVYALELLGGWIRKRLL